MKIQIPKIGFSGQPIEGAMERVLKRDAEKPKTSATPSTAQPKEGFIYIPTANIHFANQRTHLGKKWDETHELLKQENLRMPTIEEFRRTLVYFKNSPERELQNLYNEITEVREPWRSEWIDAYFEKRKDGFYLLTANKTKAEKLETCLMKDKTPGILIDDWLEGKNITSQGLPDSNISNGELYYWNPRKDCVAWFVAGSGGSSLNCGGDPSYGYSGLGVFGVTDADASGNARQNKVTGGIK